MAVEQFERFWRKVEPNKPMFAHKNLEYAKWRANGITNYGMRDAETGLAHGIVRQVKPNGWVHESSFKEGKLHGLSRQVLGGGEVWVELHQHGEEKAEFSFKDGFSEKYRKDPNGYLARLKPADFRPVAWSSLAMTPK